MRNLRCLVLLFFSGLTFSQSQTTVAPILTVKEIMNAIITPTTATIWGAYELESESEWQEEERCNFSNWGGKPFVYGRLWSGRGSSCARGRMATI